MTTPREWRFQPLVVRLLCLVGLAVSSALVSDAVLGLGTYCGAEDPCAEVAASAYGEVFGIPLGAVGLAGFGLIFALSLVPTGWARLMVRLFAAVAGLAGVALLVIQFAVLHRVCPLCLVADTSAIGLAAAALASRPPSVRPSWLAVRILGWTWAGLAAGLGPLFWAAAHIPAAAPEQVRAHWVSGQITLVEISDFDCPHCQRADPIVREWLKQRRVRFVRIVSPIPHNQNGMYAGVAYLAAVRQGKGEEMAELLYAAPSREPPACRKLAEQLGLDMARYDRDIAGPELTAELERTQKWVRPTGLGLPFFWLQDELMVGVKTPEELDEALARVKPAP